MIDTTPTGKKLLAKFKPPSKFYLQIFEFESEPLVGHLKACQGPCRGYSISDTNNGIAERTYRSEASIDSVSGRGASSNVAVRKDDVFLYRPNPSAGTAANRSKLLSVLVEELVHSNRAAFGISPPDFNGLEGFKIVPANSTGAEPLSFRQVIEELEVSGDFPPFRGTAGAEAVPSYQPIFAELKSRDATLDFTPYGTSGGYQGFPAEQWLAGIRLFTGFGILLDDRLKEKPTEALESLRQFGEWLEQVSQITARDRSKVGLHKVIGKLSKQVERAKMRLTKLCT